MLRAMYGAGMIPSRSIRSPNDSGVHSNDTWCGGSRLAAQKIFFCTEKQRSLPHFTSSMTAGKDRQICRSLAIVTAVVYRGPSQGHAAESQPEQSCPFAHPGVTF